MRGLFDEGKYNRIVSLCVSNLIINPQVNHMNVYCKGSEIAAQNILGPLGKFIITFSAKDVITKTKGTGTIVELTFARIVEKKRTKINVALVREMKATVDPVFDMRGDPRVHSSGVKTKLLFLECLQNSQQLERSAMPIAASERPEFGVRSIPEHCRKNEQTSVFSDQGQCFARETKTNESKEIKQVYFKGRWHSEDDVEQLEIMAKDLDADQPY